ncbi:MAG: AgmX/PglI C-terminal domain-containing protein [Myxococcales bacterium]|nr:AgmX/PglI C-terminal domain-containing protein [Myxococcales bacterium]
MTRGRPPIALVAALTLFAVACKKDPASEAPESTAAPASDPEDDEGPLADEAEEEESPYLDVSNFNRVVEEHVPEVVACHQSSAGGETGRVKTTFIIDGQGGVKKVTFDEQRSTLQVAALNKCIEEKAASWRFNISLTGGETPMPYTFDLTPGALLPE